MADRKLETKEIALKGRLITAFEPAVIGENFQELQNMRYTGANPRGIGGMTKRNSTGLTGKYKMRSGFHFRKEQPAESHVLVQAWNSSLDESAIYQNTNAVPGTGDFSATALLTESSGCGVGYFSEAPNGCVAFCDSKGAYIWGGDEYRISSFINYAPDESFRYDYTEQVRDTQTGSGHRATLNRVDATIDSETSLLLHLNNNVTDSSASSHSVTNHGAAIFSSDKKVFGTHSCSLDGATEYFKVTDHRQFDFNDGNFTIDVRGRLNSVATLNPIYYHANAGASSYLRLYTISQGRLRLRMVTDSANTFDLTTPAKALSKNTFYHLEAVESGDNFYLFVDGYLQATDSTSDRCRDYDASINIGYDGTHFYDGYFDEYRVSSNARHTGAFQPPTVEYGGESYHTYAYIGSTRPLQGFKLYVGTANTTAGAMTVQYWNGSSWTGVGSLSDGTAASGKPLAQTGAVTFDSTESVAKAKIINEVFLYWYKVLVTDCDATATVYHATLNAPLQTIKDIWDGNLRQIYSFQMYKSSIYYDYTFQAYENAYDSADAGTYAEIDSLSSAGDYLVLGFDERIGAASINFVPNHTNSTANTVLIVYYWNGTAWTSVGNVDDGTAESNVSFAKSGYISWNPLAEGTEYRTEIGKEVPLYYYKFVFSQSLDADVQLYYISGIPAQKTIGQYKYPVFALNKLWLLSEQDEYKNKALGSEYNSDCIFNGGGSTELYFGDESELMAGAGLYVQLGSSLYDSMIVNKKNETWMAFLDGDTLRKFKVSSAVGCVAPGTMKTLTLSDSEQMGSKKEVALWQGAEGIYIFDGRAPVCISDDIADYFDKNKSHSINRTYAANSQAFVDYEDQEYHWLFAGGSSTTLNKEFVYDLKRRRWFEIERGTGKYLQCGIEVADTNGNTYTYGAIDRYLERLEYGASFDGTAIVHKLWLGDMALHENSMTEETSLRVARLITKATNTTSNTIRGFHYKDGNETAVSSFDMAPQLSGYTIAKPLMQLGSGGSTFHSLRFSMTTSNETVGFEPHYVGMLYKRTRQVVSAGG